MTTNQWPLSAQKLLRNMKTRIFTFLVALLALATGAKAAESYPLKIAGVQINSSNCSSEKLCALIRNAGGTVDDAWYDATVKELHLKNFDITCSSPCIEYTGSNTLYIEFAGDNYLTCKGNAPSIKLSHTNGYVYIQTDHRVIDHTASVTLESWNSTALEINKSPRVTLRNIHLYIDGKTYGIDGKNIGNLLIKNCYMDVWGDTGPSVTNLQSLQIEGASDVTFIVWTSSSTAYAMTGVQSFTLGEDMVFADPSGGHFVAGSNCNIYTSSNLTWNDDIHFATTAPAINATNFPDFEFRSYVDLHYDLDNNGYLTKDELRKVTSMNVSGMHISDMKGIGYFSSLTSLNCSHNDFSSLYVPLSVQTLDCSSNKLTTLNVGENIVLTSLNCSYNQLTSLNVFPMYGVSNLTTLNCSKNNLSSLYLANLTSLQNLNCSYNNLTSLDVSYSRYLKTLDCLSNNLTSLSLSCPFLSELYCSYNTDLTSLFFVSAPTQLTDVNLLYTKLGFSMHEQLVEQLPSGSGTLYPAAKISVADVTKAKNKGWTVSGANAAGIEAYRISNTNLFPDANFRNYLAGQSYGKDDGWIEASEIGNVSSMVVNQLGIRDLKGIEYFKYLTHLEASNNQLQSLNLSSNTALQSLLCNNNSSLTGLNLSNNHEMLYLRCYFNSAMTSLNVAGCSKLYHIDALGCNLSSLNVSSCTDLKEIYCGANSLTSLNLSNNYKLEKVNCEMNRLTSFLLPNTSTLSEIRCSNNQLKGSYMWSTVGSLPFVGSGNFYVVRDNSLENEGNALSQEQLAEVMSKGWTAYHYADTWVPYTLSEPTGLETVEGAPQDGGNGYNLQGQRVGGGYKGIVVKNGRKVLRK